MINMLKFTSLSHERLDLNIYTLATFRTSTVSGLYIAYAAVTPIILHASSRAKTAWRTCVALGTTNPVVCYTRVCIHCVQSL